VLARDEFTLTTHHVDREPRKDDLLRWLTDAGVAVDRCLAVRLGEGLVAAELAHRPFRRCGDHEATYVAEILVTSPPPVWPVFPRYMR
jgi:hypothetical protein